ncbi:MAG: PilN domain-containing protein [Methylobacter sp.]
MIQQVNLYKDILKQQNKANVNPHWLGLLAIVFLFAGFSAYLIWRLNDIDFQVQEQTKILAAQQALTSQLSAQIPKQEVDNHLVAEITQQQNMLAELRQAMQLLSGRLTDKSPGFSSYFLALANQSIPEIWLKTLYFNSQQQIINIEGSTFNPEKLPYFLQQLQKEPIFNGHTFAKLVMQKAETNPEQMDFNLSTTLEASNEQSNAH